MVQTLSINTLSLPDPANPTTTTNRTQTERTSQILQPFGQFFTRGANALWEHHSHKTSTQGVKSERPKILLLNTIPFLGFLVFQPALPQNPYTPYSPHISHALRGYGIKRTGRHHKQSFWQTLEFCRLAIWTSIVASFFCMTSSFSSNTTCLPSAFCARVAGAPQLHA